jgi:transcriptional regulator with XRE-family HTH domain
MNIGKGIRRIRKEYGGHSGRELSALLGITPTWLSRIETGKKPASFELLESVAGLYNISMPMLMLFCADKKEIKDTLFSEHKALEVLIGEVFLMMKGSDKLKELRDV